MLRKIFDYFRYRRIIKDNLNLITNRYKLKYDRLYGRLYTVISIPENRQEVYRNYKLPAKLKNPIDTDVSKYLDIETDNYLRSLEEFFINIGLIELVSISKKDNVDEVNKLVVLRYKHNKHQLFLYIVISFLGLMLGISLITGFVKLSFILINFIMSL